MTSKSGSKSEHFGKNFFAKMHFPAWRFAPGTRKACVTPVAPSLLFWHHEVTALSIKPAAYLACSSKLKNQRAKSWGESERGGVPRISTFSCFSIGFQSFSVIPGMLSKTDTCGGTISGCIRKSAVGVWRHPGGCPPLGPGSGDVFGELSSRSAQRRRLRALT